MTHDLIDQRNLELDRFVVEKIRRKPELMDFVRSNLRRTLDSTLSDSCKESLKEWDDIIRTQPLDKVLSILVENSEEGQRLRQSSPFWGILSQQERMGIFHRYEQARA